MAKKNRSQMIVDEEETDLVATLHNPQPWAQQRKSHACSGCGRALHKGGRIHCSAYDKVLSCCHKVGHFARVCMVKQRSYQHLPLNDSSQPTANAIRLQSPQGDHIQLYNVIGNKADPALTITVQVTSSARAASVTVLPDSGADISAAGQAFVGILGRHLDNLAPSEINHRAVNGDCMRPVGKITVTINLQGRTCRDDIHIFVGVSGVHISWKTAKELGILPPQYPYPKGSLQANSIFSGEKHPGNGQLQQHWRGACKGFPISIQWTDQHNSRTLHNVSNGKCPAI